jgi:hypothetical protein
LHPLLAHVPPSAWTSVCVIVPIGKALTRKERVMARRSLFRKRRRSSSDALIGVLIAGAIAVAVAGVYLLALGAVALVGWLAKVILQQTRARRSAPRLVTAAGPSLAPPPEESFHEIVSTDPRAFNHPEAAEAAAIRVFSAWVAMIPKAPKDPREVITGLQIRHRHIGRLTTHVEGRRVALRCVPYTGRQKVGDPRVDPASIDPWTPPADLREASRYLAPCKACGAKGRVDCPVCDGGGRMTCSECGGGGKYRGFAANGAERLLNCRRCRGRGDVACGACVRGRIDCHVCEKAKRVECWLDIDTVNRQDVQVEPDGAITRAFRWGQDGVVATDAEIQRDAAIVYGVRQNRQITYAEAAQGVPSAWLDQYGAAVQPKLEPGERIKAQTLLFLSVPSVEVSYAVGAEQTAVELHGLRLLCPPAISERLLQERSRSLNRVGIALAAVPALATLVYTFRGAYFHTGLMAGIVIATALCAALMYGAIWNATLGRRSARTWAAASIAPALLAVGLAIVAEPSEAAARSLICAGRLTDARLELEELGDTSTSRKKLWADLLLREAKAELTIDRAKQRSARIPSGTPQAAEAVRHLDRLLTKAATEAIDRGDLKTAAAWLADLSPAARGAADARSLAQRLTKAQGEVCLTAKDWQCAVDASARAANEGAQNTAHELHNHAIAGQRAQVEQAVAAAAIPKDLEQRVAAQNAALEEWKRYAAMVAEAEPDPPSITTLRARSDADSAQLQQEQEAAHKKQEMEERKAAQALAAKEKREAAAAEREERRREAQERREERANRSLECNDGTTSPSCTCGGDWSGCCSRHGGVRGCE